MANNAAKAYGNNKINTASQAELTLMLYEGAVKFANRAKDALEVNDYETVNTNIQKCRNIIVELLSTLNHKYPVAKDFETLYNYIFALLTEANMKKGKTVLPPSEGRSGKSLKRILKFVIFCVLSDTAIRSSQL